MTIKSEKFWKKAALVFHEKASEYDGWFDHSLLFDIELAGLRDLKTIQAEPRFEIGVGPGRFAEALCVKAGLDPAFGPIKLARKRGVTACQAIGEMLPVKTKSLGSIFLLFTLCFLEHPDKVLLECYRTLKIGGHLILGTIPATSTWGKMLVAKKKENHPFYRYARFYNPGDVKSMLQDAGLKIVETRSTLFQPPDSLTEMESSCKGIHNDAGLVIFVAERGKC